MGKLRKLLISILLLGLFITLFFVIIENQQAINLPIYFISMDDYPLVGQYIQPVLFWLSLVFIVLAVLLLIMTIFYPKKSNTLTIKHENGTLKVQKKAVENFVLKIVSKEPFIENPRVKVKMYKQKIRIKIAGNLRKSMSIPDKQNALVDEVKNEVSALMGTTDNIKTEVRLEDERKENAAERSKVE
ncbi:alkaline shock response membrane anchor protein AmaP [Tetragenococcus koreensis]|uniref:Alkaline shock response membrane anchor protein AmaP n=1 Tax=Tetragenococcus koreensis TaxID=290335 RepID=A0AAN4RJK0_9ENTE|nr:alkaline shock response membrane anchor protein AmaP [Tetragenococcus koreensis]MCF1585571.1 alkaline shock response membrane anchor protein AmaP [Tetragenococcus koreensis]MCF1615117.1 alkaline shock response membrane anchor protein AmaP [Tetragenococcus koreensis]MCF1620707.1 alkaline shock response membrane anchor protein AmaP [Tetragenococcus koreensis]MCF1624945.1 alkaline shock response membrane anchor protein AmaP [Tetragenococcus koreensis]MCF1626327.1 alkaline shock response membra